jgi:hypothetical protein
VQPQTTHDTVTVPGRQTWPFRQYLGYFHQSGQAISTTIFEHEYETDGRPAGYFADPGGASPN